MEDEIIGGLPNLKAAASPSDLRFLHGSPGCSSSFVNKAESAPPPIQPHYGSIVERVRVPPRNVAERGRSLVRHAASADLTPASTMRPGQCSSAPHAGMWASAGSSAVFPAATERRRARGCPETTEAAPRTRRGTASDEGESGSAQRAEAVAGIWTPSSSATQRFCSSCDWRLTKR